MQFPELSVGLPGDYNRDGTVDAADYTVWRDTFGKIGSGLAADGNNDGQVDALDYDVWRSHFGAKSAATGVDPSAVPEPRTLSLLALGATLLTA